MKFICEITVAFAVVVLSESFLLKPQPVKSCSMKKCPPGKICVVQYGRPRCVRDPCTMVRCRPGTTCIVKGGKAYCQPDICSLPAVTGLCRAYFTRYFYNTSSARCDEFVYGGCGGNKNNFIKKVHCKEKCDDPACSPPLTTHYCKVAPCDLTKCPAYPHAKCVNNYCGGCFAEFYLNGRKVDCKKIPDTFPNSCAAVLCQVGHICVVRNGKASCKPACKSSSDCKQQGSYCDTESGVCECSRYCLLPVSLPVCGSDGKQYGSLCQLNVAACEKKTTITTGQCKPIPPPDTLPNSCAAVLCQVGYICVVRNGIASCKPACKSNSDCKQQGSYCNTESGVCECSQICPLVYLPVFDSDGKEYGNQCQLNVAVCEKKTTITPVPRKPGYTKSG